MALVLTVWCIPVENNKRPERVTSPLIMSETLKTDRQMELGSVPYGHKQYNILCNQM